MKHRTRKAPKKAPAKKSLRRRLDSTDNVNIRNPSHPAFLLGMNSERLPGHLNSDGHKRELEGDD